MPEDTSQPQPSEPQSPEIGPEMGPEAALRAEYFNFVEAMVDTQIDGSNPQLRTAGYVDTFLRRHGDNLPKEDVARLADKRVALLKASTT